MIANSKAYVERYDHQVKQLGFSLGISEPFTEKSPPETSIKKLRAIWDTGTSTTVIQPEVASSLGLKPMRPVPFWDMHGESGEHPVYLVDLHLPNGQTLPAQRVIGAKIANPNIDVLVGMDVLHHGDFAVTHANGSTTVSFRTPSCGEIDFEKERNEAITR